VVFVGASRLAVTTARKIIAQGHEVVIIDKDRDKVDWLRDELDCGLLHADGSRPSVLREAGAEHTEMLFCLGDDDQDNILASLVGRELGYRRVVTRIEDPDYEPICHELGLDDPIIPSRRIAENLVDLLEGRETAGLNTVLSGGLRFFAFVIDEEHAGSIADLDLGDHVRIIAVTRGDRSRLPTGDTRLEIGDEVALVAHEKAIDALRRRFLADAPGG
jgi:trk system potassium uptake protein TrkA